MKPIINTSIWSCFLLYCCSGTALAHAAEQGFVLLLPTGAYTVAGTMAVVASIALLMFLPARWSIKLFSTRNLKQNLSLQLLKTACSIAGTALFFGLVFIGFKGPSDPQANLLPLTIWTIWWVALFVIQGVVFDIWGWFNPWSGLYKAINGTRAPLIRLPSSLSSWPAVIVFLCFQGFVLTDIAPNDPRRLASFVLGYWGFTLVGMLLFGKESWVRQVECFSVMFRLIGLLRPLHDDQGVKLGLPGWAAIAQVPHSASHAAFCLIILASGSFDGLHETFWWMGKIGVNPLEFPGRSAVFWPTAVGLYSSNIALYLIFAGAIWLGILFAGQRRSSLSFADAFKYFTLALLPIALGYHFAHYFVTFLVQIQYVIATLADPLAKGWNLFGLGSATIRTGFLATPSTVKLIWLTQASVVVGSHMLSVLMSHRIAQQLCPNGSGVIRLQIGLSVLMVFYTVFGLWLLASPRGA